MTHFIKIGERVRYLAKIKYRNLDWLEGTWMERGVTGTVSEYHRGHAAMTFRGDYFERIPPWALVKWNNGASTAIDAEDENERWERIQVPSES